MKPCLTFLFLMVFSLKAIGQNSTKQDKLIAKDVSVKEFATMMNEHPGLLLDVRTKGEVAKGAIANSMNVDIFSDNFEAEIDKLDKNKPVYVYCASGGRSGEAMELMHKKGFKKVYNLAGGYSAWKKEMVK